MTSFCECFLVVFVFISFHDNIVFGSTIDNGSSNCTFKTLSFSPTLQLPNNLSAKALILISDNGFNTTNEDNYITNTKNELRSNSEWVAIIISKPSVMPVFLMRQANGDVLILKNRTKTTQWFWKFNDDGFRGWSVPFRDCSLTDGLWLHAYSAADNSGASITIFVKLILNRCDNNLREVFKSGHLCDEKTTQCVPIYESNVVGDYKCVCKRNYYYATAKDTWNGVLRKDIERSSISDLGNACHLCPRNCKDCETTGLCLYKPNELLRLIILVIQVICMIIVIIVSVIVVMHRKDKVIQNSMWIMLETILLGIWILYFDVQYELMALIFKINFLNLILKVILHLLNGFEAICIIESWFKELGFILCYGSVFLKLYKHLIEFRTRKAHRWIIKNFDLLKYLTVMFAIMCAYMLAFSTFVLHLKYDSDFTLLKLDATGLKQYFVVCKLTLWNFATIFCELVLLFFACRTCYFIRRAKIHENENKFLNGTVINEFLMTIIFTIIQTAYYTTSYYNPDFVVILQFCRCHLTTTPTFLIIFVPKIFYQRQYNELKRQSANNNEGPDSSSIANSDGDLSAVSLAQVDPELVKVELKRLYHEIETMREKCLYFNNPHIQTKKSSLKSTCRRLSFQALRRKHSRQSIKHKASDIHQSPENSVFSVDGQSSNHPGGSLSDHNE